MNLLEICEPLFLYICVLNRIGRMPDQGKTYDYETVRSSVDRLLEDMLPKAAADFPLQEQIRKIELPLMFFVDGIISESQLGFAGQWNADRLAIKKNEHAGDEKFFQLIATTLTQVTPTDPTPQPPAP